MSALFSWPTVTVGMRLPFLPGRGLHLCGGPGAGRLRLRAGTPLTIAPRGAPRARGNHRPVLWPAARAAPLVAPDHLLSVHLRHAETNLRLLHMQHDHRGHRRGAALLTATGPSAR